MEKIEAKSTVKAIYLQSAALAGLEVSPESPEHLAGIVEQGFDMVIESRRPEAVANTLRLIAAAVESVAPGQTMLHESNVYAGHDKVCPVYPFK